MGRFIAENCKNSEIHIIEPHPTNYAKNLASTYKNLKFIDALDGDYDVIVATDVFEHLEDPLTVVEYISKHLNNQGYMLAANCFYPVIKCHLPKTFHFRYGWKPIMKLQGFSYVEKILYGEAYQKIEFVPISKKTRIAEYISKFSYPMIEMMRFAKNIIKKCA